MELTPQIRLEVRKELTRRYFWDYCRLKYPKHYTSDRVYLKEMCERIQAFSEQNVKRFLIINVPPRHYKLFTGSGFVEWTLGKQPERKIMTGSYNEELSSTFATKVRDTIDEQPSPGVLTFHDIFPETRIKYGQAAMKKWALEGNTQASYLATSPTGTATGFGANDIVIDGIIKNAQEAYDDAVLEKHWNWLTNTMLSRTEGDDWKVYAMMTRWAEGDLAGRIIEAFGDLVEVITFKAVQDDGTMLCESVLNRADYDLKTQVMALEIVEANYNQKPIDVTGRLFGAFGEYDSLPEGEHKRRNYTDTADKGTDSLCSVDYIDDGVDVYVTDVVMTDEGMEETEPAVAAMLDSDEVDEAIIESNNRGRGFARNIERLLRDTHDKEVRRQVGGTGAQQGGSHPDVERLGEPPCLHATQLEAQVPEFYRQLAGYQRKGKNKHDDAPDVLAAIYGRVANPSPPEEFRVRIA